MRSANGLGQIFKFNLPARGNDHGALDRVFKLTNISQPLVSNQGLQRIFGNTGDKPAGLLFVMFDEVYDQRMNILWTFTQRRQDYGKHREAIDTDHVETFRHRWLVPDLRLTPQ